MAKPSPGYFYELERLVLQYLSDATDLKLSLDPDEGAYHLAYVSKKITECAVAMEKLSDMQMQLTKISLEVTKFVQDARFLLRKELAFLQAGPDYQQMPAAQRAGWLQSKTELREKEVDSLNYLTRVVSEVRGAISDRIQTMKRLDSDVRLHQKLLEGGGLGSNATSASAFTGSKKTDLEL